MSGEHYSLQQVQPVETDEILVIRDRAGKRATISDLKQSITPSQSDGAIARSQTPPSDAALWLQTDNNDLPIAFWQRRPGDIWVSEPQSAIFFRNSMTSNGNFTAGNPFPGSRMWIESFAVSGIVGANFAEDGRWDFQLSYVNQAKQQAALWLLSLESGLKGTAFTLAEPIGDVLAPGEALAFRFRSTKTGGPNLSYISYSAQLRRVYDDA